ncbi:hypothetical protein SAMN02745163_02563 [Clostridium cavendishii DSM 21758]|uniref:ABC-2 family transporter protein n=1 Tax=Clostridium cavendishii DSM 21758 TaxID=1121302 RepID=A0A1M6M1M2_9CLOT|nr:hypothetical protein [Clostridium cavendishii]SHJ77316.1 hypothetical protein SAMN02745163_02563 [Clostridium cavendishii DSM 21758]
MKELQNKFDFIEISAEEIDELCTQLDKYTIDKMPSDEEINNCIESLYTYVPEKKSFKNTIIRLVDIANLNISYINKCYLTISFMIFLFNYILAIKFDVNPYMAIMSCTPIPFLLGLIEIFKGIENNMSELEASFKISFKEIVISKILIIAIFNIILNIIMSVMLYTNIRGIEFAKINVLWLITFCWINLISIIIAQKVRSNKVAILLIAIWTIIVSVIFSNSIAVDMLIKLNTWIYVLFICIAIGVATLLLKNFIKSNNYFYKESNDWDMI